MIMCRVTTTTTTTRYFFFFLAYSLISTLNLTCCATQQELRNYSYDLVPLQGTTLEIYETTTGVRQSGRCSFRCSKRIFSSPNRCAGFRHDPIKGECELYILAAALVTSSDVYLFRFRLMDTFHTVLVGDRTYSLRFPTPKKNYGNARKYCRTFGAYLLYLDAPDKGDIVGQFMSSSMIVGANDKVVEGRWVSDRDGQVIPRSNLRWKSSEPSGSGGEDCAKLLTNRYLYDGQCKDMLQIVCERDV